MATKPKPSAKPKPKAKTQSKVISLNPTTDKQYQIQDDARMLKRAQEIRNDPARMKAAKEYCVKEMETMKQVTKMK